MIAGIYNFKTHETGSTFKAVEFWVEVNKRRISLAGAVIVMTMTYLSNTYTISTTTGGLIITDEENGVFVFDEQIITLPVGNYQHNITITLADGSTFKWIKGNWRII